MPETTLGRSDAPVPVLHLVDTLHLGGTERQLLELLRTLDRRRWRPLAASLHAEGPLRKELATLDVPHFAVPLRASLGHPNTAWQIARLAWHCRRHGVRLLHAHDFYSDVIGVAAARLAGIRAIASRRDLAHWLSRAQLALLGASCRLADRVIANARSVGEQAIAKLGVARERLVVVPNGLDLARFDAEAALEPDPPLDLPVDPPAGLPTVAVVSSMHLPDKGHADLIEAMALLRERGRRFQLLLVGDGAERAHLEHLVHRLGLAGDVRFLGRRSDVPRLLARVDAACLPSWAEGFPNAVMEAMAASLPVVATRVGGTPELLRDGETGLLVEPHQPGELADALERILSDLPRARELGERGRIAVEDHHSLAATTRRWESVYASVLGAAPAGVAALAIAEAV